MDGLNLSNAESSTISSYLDDLGTAEKAIRKLEIECRIIGDERTNAKQAIEKVKEDLLVCDQRIGDLNGTVSRANCRAGEVALLVLKHETQWKQRNVQFEAWDTEMKNMDNKIANQRIVMKQEQTTHETLAHKLIGKFETNLKLARLHWLEAHVDESEFQADVRKREKEIFEIQEHIGLLKHPHHEQSSEEKTNQVEIANESAPSELQCRAQELQDLKTILSEIPQYEQMLQSSLEQRICVACLRQNQTSADAE